MVSLLSKEQVDALCGSSGGSDTTPYPASTTIAQESTLNGDAEEGYLSDSVRSDHSDDRASDLSYSDSDDNAAHSPGVHRKPLTPVKAPVLEPTVTCKVLVVGNAKCGKSSIIHRYVHDQFDPVYTSTVGCDYVKKDLLAPNGVCVRLQLWDIAGQDRFVKLTRAYFRRAKGAIIVCDVTREGTFEAVSKWKDEIDDFSAAEGCTIPVYLIANKSDLLDDVQTSFLAGATMEKTCRLKGIQGFYVTSAKEGDNIDPMMQELLAKMLENEPSSDLGAENGDAQHTDHYTHSAANGQNETFTLTDAPVSAAATSRSRCCT